ncbi:MAG: hypothetical protein CFE21_15705 [Bacteroidetes bacterium B1(2017)]|nr:MAG: hypothetical protein CFE21_15705 [Bacteroidetes bacterium B1(2017)]
MKKLILIFAAFCSLQVALAQSVSFNPKVSKGQGPNGNFQIDAKSIFTNTSSDTVFEWQVLDIVSPSGWEFGMCDPFNCITNLAIGNTSTFNLATGKSGEFKGDFAPNGKPGNGKAIVYVYSKKNPSTINDTIEFQINAWVTAVKEVQNNKEFSFYPNPAKDRLNIKYATKEGISIDIYNVLGSKMKTIMHTGFETEINIGDLQNGIYFIRFKDGNQTISKPFTKSE